MTRIMSLSKKKKKKKGSQTKQTSTLANTAMGYELMYCR